MVMHARKHSRLNDGYADRKDTHLHQDMQYHSSLFANDSDDDRHADSRVSSRYQNKHSYIERNKEKRGGLSLAEEKVNHYLATGSLGRAIPMDSDFPLSDPIDHDLEQLAHPRASGSHRDRGSYHRERDYNGHYPKNSGDHRASSSYNHSSEHSNKVPYVQGGDINSHPERDKMLSANNGKSSSGKDQGKDKEQVQKSAIRVCGDWSEHISSSGKRYYYNCKTEVSQWEKPKDWVSEMCKTPEHARSKDGRPKAIPSTNKVVDSRTNRHSIDQERSQGYRGNNADDSHNSHPRDSSSVARNDSHSSNRDYARDNSRDIMGSRDPYKSNMDRGRGTDNTSVNSYHGNEDSHHKDYKRLQPDSHTSSSSQHPEFKRSNVDLNSRRRRDSQTFPRHNDPGPIPIDDMDISPSYSLSPSSRPSSATDIPSHMPATSTPVATATTPGHTNSMQGGRAPSPQGNPIPTLVNRQTHQAAQDGNYDKNKTIQALKDLQVALSMQMKRQREQATTSTGGQGPAMHSNNPAMSNNSLIALHPTANFSQNLMSQGQGHPVSANGDDDVGGRTSPVSATSSRSSCGSPTPSDSSSQNAAINTQALTAAAMKREETAKLTASLSNYYNEKLIGHVLGWQADVVEKQALKLGEESMMMGSHQCSKVSVELKRARSQVRIAEIQSTLHEQRIMSSDHQRQEIDSLKTPSSFLPS